MDFTSPQTSNFEILNISVRFRNTLLPLVFYFGWIEASGFKCGN